MPDDSGKQREIVDQQAMFPFASSMSKLGDPTKLLDIGAHLLIDVNLHLLQVCALQSKCWRCQHYIDNKYKVSVPHSGYLDTFDYLRQESLNGEVHFLAHLVGNFSCHFSRLRATLLVLRM